MAYLACADPGLEYVRSTSPTGRSSSDWNQLIRIDDPAGPLGISLVVVDGNPAISYWHYGQESLKYARSSTSTGNNVSDWTVLTLIDEEESVGVRSSLAVINGKPAISCYAGDPVGDLVFISANDSTGGSSASWEAPCVVDSDGDTGKPSSLAEVNGQPAIAFRDITDNCLRYAFYCP